MSGGDETDRVLVVGGGASGLAIAGQLARSAAPVTLLEARSPGAGATTRNQGWLHSGGLYAPTHPSVARLCYDSLQTTQRFCPECLEPGHDGMFYAMARAASTGEWSRAWADAGIPHTRASTDELRERAPMLDPASVQAAFVLPDRAVRYDVLLEKLARTLVDAGGEIRTGTRVARLLREGDAVVGVATADGEEVRARVVILAGNATGIFLNPRPPESSVEDQVAHRVIALKSHLAAATPGAGGFPLTVVDAEGFNHIPHGTTSVFGADRWIAQTDPENQEVDPAEVELLSDSIRRFFPDLVRASPQIETWAGITLQAFQPGVLHPALIPAPAVLDHSRDRRPVHGVLSVFAGRATLWPHVAERTAEAVRDKLPRTIPKAVPPPWRPESPS